ncbi:MAG: NADH-quinone oxidoreductase subunit C [Opitutales bacterium]|nr:NADH-quinone oxidoreductase subunit C [Opitutales bacterium]
MSRCPDHLFERFQELFPAMEMDTPAPPEDSVGNEDGADAAEPRLPPPPPCRKTEHAKVGYDLDAIVEPHQIEAAAKLLDAEGFAIDMVTAVDWPDAAQFELVYDFMHFQAATRVCVRTRIPRDRPEIATLSHIYPGANWHERETAEFYGIQFTGHPNPIHLLLPEDFVGYPLRKDFKPQPDPLLEP